MNRTWYELELMPLDKNKINFYKNEFDRSDINAGFDLHASEAIHIEQTPMFVSFGLVARLLKVEPYPGGTSNDWLKTDSHFWLMPRSSIYKSGIMMGNSTGVIDKSYRGELKAPVWSLTANSDVAVGDRLFQIVAPDMGWIRNVRLVDSMPQTERGAGGFGSTGK
jgi:dUTP pyrophosphatase